MKRVLPSPLFLNQYSHICFLFFVMLGVYVEKYRNKQILIGIFKFPYYFENGLAKKIKI